MILRDKYLFRSARSLAGSGTPPLSTSYFRVAKSGPSALAIENGSSSDEDETLSTCHLVITAKTITQPRPIPGPVCDFLLRKLKIALGLKNIYTDLFGFSDRFWNVFGCIG